MKTWLLGAWALGYRSGIRIHWYTPLLCRLLGDLHTDQQNGCRAYTFKGVTLIIPRIDTGASAEKGGGA
jgi:hypothetical protein